MTRIFSVPSSIMLTLGVVSMMLLATSSRAESLAYVLLATDKLAVVNVATRSVVRELPLSAGAGVGALAVNAVGNRVYVIHRGDISVGALLDAQSGVRLATPGLYRGAESVALSPDGTRLLVTDREGLTILETIGHKLLGKITRPDGYAGVVVNARGDRAYVAARTARQVAVIDPVKRVVAGAIPTGTSSSPVALALNRDGSRLYIADPGSGAVIVADTQNNSVVASILVGPGVNAVAVAPDGTRAWFTDGTGRVGVIDAGSNRLLKSVDVGGMPNAVALSEDGSQIYVVGATGDALAVLDAASLAVLATIPLGASPMANAQFIAHAPLPAVEYFHSSFGHYFVTAIPAEIGALDQGAFSGWQRSGERFGVQPAGAPGMADVCRFFSESFSPKSSHFYTPSVAECATVMQNASWSFEGTVFSMGEPDDTGACPSGLARLFRLYNDGSSGAPNHRYTTRISVQGAMLAQGWIAEGAGAMGVIGCVAE